MLVMKAARKKLSDQEHNVFKMQHSDTSREPRDGSTSSDTSEASNAATRTTSGNPQASTTSSAPGIHGLPDKPLASARDSLCMSDIKSSLAEIDEGNLKGKSQKPKFMNSIKYTLNIVYFR